MLETGWRVYPERRSAYYIGESFDLSERERELYSDLMSSLLEESGRNGGRLRDGAEFSGLSHSLLKKICGAKFPLLRRERAELIERIAAMNVRGFGVLGILLADDALEEIAVTGVNEPIRVYSRDGGWMDTNCAITSREGALELINRMARPLGRRITFSKPMLNATLPDGSRLHASIPPATANGVEMTIRKFTKEPLSMLELIRKKTISAEAAAFLWLAAFGDTSILVAGNTGSGKTTLLNSLLPFVPLDERIILAEETPELLLRHPHTVSLLSNEPLGITMPDIVHASLRMRPDRMVIGEVRTRSEVQALFESMQAGQAKGCLATFHAKSAAECASRLGGLGVLAQDLGALDLIVVLRRISRYDPHLREKGEARRVTEIAEIEGGKPARLFYYDGHSDSLLPETEKIRRSSILRKLLLNYKSDAPAIMHEMKKRQGYLEMLLERPPMRFAEFTKHVQEYSFGAVLHTN